VFDRPLIAGVVAGLIVVWVLGFERTAIELTVSRPRLTRHRGGRGCSRVTASQLQCEQEYSDVTDQEASERLHGAPRADRHGRRSLSLALYRSRVRSKDLLDGVSS
jgi:hypothetical protein